MKRPRGVFRQQAKEARDRLGRGDECAKEDVTAVRTMATYFQARPTKEEEEFYAKVTTLLIHGVENPLAHILDRAYMDGLNAMERERYVLNLSARVKDCIKRWERAS